jgi:hypothetical protein
MNGEDLEKAVLKAEAFSGLRMIVDIVLRMYRELPESRQAEIAEYVMLQHKKRNTA